MGPDRTDRRADRLPARSDGRIAVSVHQVVRDATGATIADGIVTHVYSFVAGQVTEMEIRS